MATELAVRNESVPVVAGQFDPIVNLVLDSLTSDHSRWAKSNAHRCGFATCFDPITSVGQTRAQTQ
jgi:hypothetical protein